MSKIEWTDQTWNVIIGCSKTSPGCDNCYAEKMAVRLSHIETTAYYQSVTVHRAHGTPKSWNGRTFLVLDAIKKPLKRKKPTKYFVCSMGDLFHENVPFEWIDKVMEVIHKCPQHIFQILTKRPQRMLEYYAKRVEFTEGSKFPMPLPNIWLGVTSENQEQANKRIPILLSIPAAKHFVSIEPMLSEIELTKLYLNGNENYTKNALTGCFSGKSIEYDSYMGPKLDWVIVGGESGHKARPMHPDWVRSVRDQCKAAKVPFLFKQWGEWIIADASQGAISSNKPYGTLFPDGKWIPNIFDEKGNLVSYGASEYHKNIIGLYRVGKKQAGRLLDGREHNEFPK